MNTCRISSLNDEPLHISSTQPDFRQTTCGTLCYRNIRLHREPGNSAYCNLPFTTYLRVLWDQFAEQLNLEISQVRVHRERLHSLPFLLLSVPFRKLQIVSNKHRNYPVLTLIKHSAASILSFLSHLHALRLQSCLIRLQLRGGRIDHSPLVNHEHIHDRSHRREVLNRPHMAHIVRDRHRLHQQRLPRPNIHRCRHQQIRRHLHRLHFALRVHAVAHLHAQLPVPDRLIPDRPHRHQTRPIHRIPRLHPVSAGIEAKLAGGYGGGGGDFLGVRRGPCGGYFGGNDALAGPFALEAVHDFEDESADDGDEHALEHAIGELAAVVERVEGRGALWNDGRLLVY